MMGRKRKPNEKPDKLNSVNFMDIINLDLEKADEFLLRAKKKILEDTYRDEDQEDILFNEMENKEVVENITENVKEVFKSTSHSSNCKRKCKTAKNSQRNGRKVLIKPEKLIPSLVHKELVLEHNRQKHKLSADKNNCIDNNNKRSNIKQLELQPKESKEHKSEKYRQTNTIPKNQTREAPKYLEKISDNSEDTYHNVIRKQIKKEISTRNKPKSIETITKPEQKSVQKLEVERPFFDCSIEESHRRSSESHRRPIRVDGSSLRQKMLERLQAAQSRYTGSCHRSHAGRTKR